MVEQHKHRQRGYTEADWLGIQGDPILGLREVAWVLDTGEHVIGDGVTAFSGLDRHGGSGVEVSATEPSSPQANDLWLDTAS